MSQKPSLQTSPDGYRIGYARVSTEDQNLELQRNDLRQANCREIYEEKASGRNSERPELQACLKALRPGDTLVVWKLDRLGRSLPNLVSTVNDLAERGVAFESLTENIETGSPTGKLVFHIFAALADFERDLIRERTMAGLAAARRNGRIGGRPRKLQAKDVEWLRNAGDRISLRKAAAVLKVSKSTVHTYLKRAEDSPSGSRSKARLNDGDAGDRSPRAD
jgi:DNA invertase Pin-like site-specific DNA recombinase